MGLQTSMCGRCAPYARRMPPAPDAPHADAASSGAVAEWFTEHVPDGWFTLLEVAADRDEVLVVGTLAAPSGDDRPDDVIARFREATRDARMRLARQAEHRFGRKVSWGARCGDVRLLFTVLSVPAMTRLRFAERAVLDTLIDAGVARSRSDALAWCVRWVGANQEQWLADLRAAFAHVEAVRAAGPQPPEPT